MPAQLITGTDCCPCACPDTVIFNQTTVIQGAQITTGTVDPSAPPTDPTQPALYVNLVTTVSWVWDTSLQVWIAIAGGGGGGNQEVYHNQGAPNTFPAPANPNAPAINYDDSNGGFISLWNTATQVWY